MVRATTLDRMLGLAAGAALALMAFLSPLSRPAFANDAEPPWGVLIAGSFSKEAALGAFARVERAYADIIGGMHPFVCTTLRSGDGFRPFYRVRLGARSLPEAERLCSQLKAAGGACVVLRNCE
jgi:SPOR domain